LKQVKELKSIRSNFGMTMEQFADLIGNAQKGNINNWERGFSLPNKERLIKIAELSNKTIDWIKWGTLEEYITSYLIGIGYELYIKDFPEIPHKVFKDIQEKYSDTFSLDKDYELLDSIIKIYLQNITQTVELIDGLKEENSKLKEKIKYYECLFDGIESLLNSRKIPSFYE
jgi:transcriptional regulator with XRE-family HTH domain